MEIPAPTPSVTAADVLDPPAIVSSSAASDTARPSLRKRGMPFAPGHDARRNANGRPRKGESLPEKLHKRVEKDADKVIDAIMRRLTREDAVGNRAFADVRDTVYGIPKQTLVLEQGESVANALDQELAAYLATQQLPPAT